MSAYAFTLVDASVGDVAGIGKFQSALAKLRPSCSSCGKTLTKRELASRVRDERVTVDVMDASTNRGYLATSCRCEDRAECLLRSCYAGGPGVRLDGTRGAAMDLAGFRALRKRQAAHGASARRERVRAVIATPAPIVATPVPVDTPVGSPTSSARWSDTPVPVLDTPGHVSGITTVVATLPAPVAPQDLDAMDAAWNDHLDPAPDVAPDVDAPRFSPAGQRAQHEADRRAGRVTS